MVVWVGRLPRCPTRYTYRTVRGETCSLESAMPVSRGGAPSPPTAPADPRERIYRTRQDESQDGDSARQHGPRYVPPGGLVGSSLARVLERKPEGTGAGACCYSAKARKRYSQQAQQQPDTTSPRPPGTEATRPLRVYDVRHPRGCPFNWRGDGRGTLGWAVLSALTSSSHSLLSPRGLERNEI